MSVRARRKAGRTGVYVFVIPLPSAKLSMNAQNHGQVKAKMHTSADEAPDRAGEGEMYTAEMRARLHSLELRIACEIRRICEKNGLRYFLTAGTLLGAVRHGGFIPWDDDMDIGMPRADYDAFVAACPRDLGPEFVLQTWDNDPDYPFPAGKVRLKGTRAPEKFSLGNDGSDGRDGIYVDIFPFDAVPDGAWAARLQGLRYFIFKRLLWIKKGYGKSIRDESWRQRLKYDVFRAIAAFFSYDSIKRRCDRMQRRYNGLPTRRVVTNGAHPFENEAILRAWMDDLAPVRFEGEEFMSYGDRDAYLRHMYGDYMALPPENERVGHEFRGLDFGPYAGEAGKERP